MSKTRRGACEAMAADVTECILLHRLRPRANRDAVHRRTTVAPLLTPERHLESSAEEVEVAQAGDLVGLGPACAGRNLP